ncbi:hypothetical protein GGR54DRAFT_178138 [Hypoxylon sp. NC1633]|nr:hypothetical protein GGR54DRAFT_178138 [Hypoxylon sp. NC1633]
MAVDDRGPQLALTIALFVGLSAVTVALRCYVRACILKAFKVEDGLAVATMMSFILYCTIAMLSISHGAGKHLEDVPLENIPKVLQMRWAAELAYVVTSLFLKFTVGVFLLRICLQAWQKAVIYVVLAVCLIYHLFYAFIAAFQCQPVAYFWYKYTGEISGKCWSNDLIIGSTYTAAGINAIADWVLGLLPIAIVRSLDLSKRTKVMVSCTLGLGSLASTATIVRIPYVWLLTQPGDFMYQFTDMSIWSTVENGLGLTASSIATLRPLVKAVFGEQRLEEEKVEEEGTLSPQKISCYSWRRSQFVEAYHYRTSSGNVEVYRMADYGAYEDAGVKAPERVLARERSVFDIG